MKGSGVRVPSSALGPAAAMEASEERLAAVAQSLRPATFRPGPRQEPSRSSPLRQTGSVDSLMPLSAI